MSRSADLPDRLPILVATMSDATNAARRQMFASPAVLGQLQLHTQAIANVLDVLYEIGLESGADYSGVGAGLDPRPGRRTRMDAAKTQVYNHSNGLRQSIRREIALDDPST